MERIPVLICIDVEPKERAITPHVKKDWDGFENLFEFFMRERARFEAVTGLPAHFSWFLRMDPQIAHTYGSYEWVATRYADLFKALEAEGDEIGLHPHAWRWDKRNKTWFQDFASQEWVDHCVRSSFEAFERVFTRPCQSIRFGDRWMNDVTLGLIESLGARFDLTIEPGCKEVAPDLFTGSFPDFTHSPRHPYRPSRSDFTVSSAESTRRLLAIPLSTESTKWTGNFPPIKKASESRASAPKQCAIYEGYLDSADCHLITGWAWDVNKPDAPVDVEIYDGDALLDTASANIYRPDLKRVGKGNGKHCFRFAVPDSIKDGKPRLIRAKIAESDYHLYATPKEYACPDNGACQKNCFSLNLGDHPGLFCLLADKLLQTGSTQYMALIMRSDVGSYEHLMLQLGDNVDYLLSHDLAGRFAFETPQEMGQRFI